MLSRAIDKVGSIKDINRAREYLDVASILAMAMCLDANLATPRTERGELDARIGPFDYPRV